jgi:hypothetical protein
MRGSTAAGLVGLVLLSLVATPLAASSPEAPSDPVPAGSIADSGPSPAILDSGTVPPFLDATSAVIEESEAFPDRPEERPTSAQVKERGAADGGDVAKVRLRIEGKGDPIVQRYGYQEMVLLSHSASMAAADPSDSRCEFTRSLAENFTEPDELGLADYDSTGRVAVPLGTSYQQVANWAQCYAVGPANLSAGLGAAINSIVPAKKPGHFWIVILITDGNISGPDPLHEAERAAQEGVRVFVLCMDASGAGSCENPTLAEIAQRTGGKLFMVAESDLPGMVEFFIPDRWPPLKDDVAGKPPKNGDPMVTFGLGPDIEVVPNSFRCISSCSKPSPDAPPRSEIRDGNRGLVLEWLAPVRELRVKQVWELEFSVRAHRGGPEVLLSDVDLAEVRYDRFDGSPGGSDEFGKLELDVIAKNRRCISACGFGFIHHEAPGHAPAGIDLPITITAGAGGSATVCYEYGRPVSSESSSESVVGVRMLFSVPGVGSGSYSMEKEKVAGSGWEVVLPGRWLVAGHVEYRFEVVFDAPIGRIILENRSGGPFLLFVEGEAPPAPDGLDMPWIDIVLTFAAGAAAGAVLGQQRHWSGTPSGSRFAGAPAPPERLRRRQALAASPATTRAIRRAAQKRRKEG